MQDRMEVTLIKITPDKVITIGEDQYLMVDELPRRMDYNPPRVRYNAPGRQYDDTAEMQKAILEILTKRPGLRAGMIREQLATDYDIPVSFDRMRGCMQRMRRNEKIFREGEKAQAVWYVKID